MEILSGFYQALDLPDIIDFEQWNQSRKSWNSFVPSFMMMDMGDTIMEVMDEIIADHKRTKCFSFLCCQIRF